MKRVLPVAVGIAMAIIGWQLWDKNEGADMKDKEGYYQELCEKGVKTNAVLQDEYTHTKGKIIDIVTYKYDYEVDGKTYTGEISEKKLPDSREIEITYLPENPEVSQKGDPCKTYESIKNNHASSFLMYTGITLFFVGILVAWSGFKRLVRRNK